MDIQYVSQSTGLYTTINFGRLLGNGIFGSVYELNDNSHKPTDFACKQVVITANPTMNMTQRDVLRKTINEINALDSMGLLEGYARKGNTFYIAMKKVEGKNPNISTWNMPLVQSSFNALRDCHRKNITHFDSHSGNFLTDPKTGKTTAIDFGLSRDASFINIFLDSLLFMAANNVIGSIIQTPSLGLLLFVQDYFTYVRHHKLEAITNLAWWGGLIYGALYGMPTLMLPNHFFYDYLKSKLLFQAFLELRGLGLLKQNCAVLVSSFFMNKNLQFFIHRCNLDIIFKHIFKPVYIASLYAPYTMFKNFYEANTESVQKFWSFLKNLTSDNLKNNVANLASNVPHPSNLNYETGQKILENFYELMAKENIKSFIDATSTQTIFQAALLYYPVKAGLTFINDAVINPLQPDFVAKARADLYFQHHPKLYAKAAANTLYNTTASCFNYLHPHKPAFS